MTEVLDSNLNSKGLGGLETFKSSFNSYTTSIQSTLTQLQALFLKYNPPNKYTKEIEKQFYKPVCNFSRLINIGLKALVNDLYQTSKEPTKFKREVYDMLEQIRDSRNSLLGLVEGELDAARKDPYRVKDRPVDFGKAYGVNYNPDLLEAIGKLAPALESTEASQSVDTILRQITRFTTIYPTPHSIFIGEVNSQGEKEGLGVYVNNQTKVKILSDTNESLLDSQMMMEDTNDLRTKAETTVYFGSFRHNEFDGMGTLIDTKGDRYEGLFLKGRKTGNGKITYSDGGTYEGFWLDDLRHGFGVQETFEGLHTLDGDQKDDEQLLKDLISLKKDPKTQSDDHSPGKLRRLCGVWEKGELKLRNLNESYLCGNSLKDFKQIEGFVDKEYIPSEGLQLIHMEELQAGQANVIYHDGSTYSGDWIDYQRNGKGVLRTMNGGFWDGEWRDDQKHGFFQYKDAEESEVVRAVFHEGKLMLDNLSDQSFGFEIKNLINGRQKIVYSDGDIYDGDFREFLYHGDGTLQTNSGCFLYKCKFQHGKKHGVGTLSVDGGPANPAVYFQDEEMVVGIRPGYTNFSFAQLIDGEATIQFENGETYSGGWLNCRYHGQGKFLSSDGDEYSGQYENGEKRGIGYSLKKGSSKKVYSVWDKDQEVIQDIRFNPTLTNSAFLNGICQVEYGDGTSYNGSWLKYKYNGYGELTSETVSYKGTWIDGRKNGEAAVLLKTVNAAQIEKVKEQWKANSAVPDFDGFFSELAKHAGKPLLCNFYDNCPILVDLDVSFHTENPLDVEELKTGCKAIIQFGNGDKYCGQIKNFKYHGEGEMKYKDGECYDGEWLNGVQNGVGTLKKGGKTIKGTFRDGVLESVAENALPSERIPENSENNFKKSLISDAQFNYPNGEKYDGQVMAGKIRYGKGIYTYVDGSQYIGEWRNNQRQGIGITIDPNGSQELGVWERDKLVIGGIDIECTFNRSYLQSGIKKEAIQFKNGDLYDGEWHAFKMHGQGKLLMILDSGAQEVYEGEFSQGKKHGKGMLKNPDGTIYGVWFEDELRIPTTKEMLDSRIIFSKLIYGYEEVTYSNGDQYKGDWKNCQKDGTGLYIWADGSEYKGSWKHDEQFGYGVFTTKTRYQNLRNKNIDAFKTNNTTNNDLEDQDDQLLGKQEDEENGLKLLEQKLTLKGLWRFCELKVQNIKHDQEQVFLNAQNQNRSCFEIVQFDDGSTYEGMWRNFKKHGRGILSYSSNKKFEGFFKDGLVHGHGRLLDKDMQVINEGCWFEGLQISTGKPSHDLLMGNIQEKTIEYKNGDKYTGRIQKFEKEGLGYEQYSKGGQFHGFFKDNCKHGLGKFSFMGSTSSGIWIRDQQVDWFERSQNVNFRDYFTDEFQAKMIRLQNKYIEGILNFRHLSSCSKREGLEFIRSRNIDLFDQFKDILKFKMIEQQQKENFNQLLEDGEHNYDGDWEVNRQNYYISQSRIDLPSNEEFRNKYRGMLTKVKEEHERSLAHDAIAENMSSQKDSTKQLNDDDKSKSGKDEDQANTARTEKAEISDAQKKAILDVQISTKNKKEFEEGSVILEAIKDGEVDIFAEIVITFIQKGEGSLKYMKQLFSHKDSQNRNALHLAAFYGRGVLLLNLCAIIKLLIKDAEGHEVLIGSNASEKKKKKTLLKHLIPTDTIKKGFKKGFDMLGKLLKIKKEDNSLAAWYKNLFFAKDKDGNTPLDLACLRGYSQTQDDLSTLTNKDLDLITEFLKEIDDGKLKLLQESGKHKLFGKYHDDMENIRQRFNQFAMNKSSGVVPPVERRLTKKYNLVEESPAEAQNTQDPRLESTSQLHFVSCRAFCVKTLIVATTSMQSVEKLIPKSSYRNRNNPLHWAFYWADLYSVVFLMQLNMQMIFWQNEEFQCPPHMIFRTKSDELRNRSIIILESVLGELSEYLKLKLISQKYFNGTSDNSDQVTLKKDKEDQENSVQYNLKLQNIAIIGQNYLLHSETLCKFYIKKMRERMNFELQLEEYTSKNYLAVDYKGESNFAKLLSGLLQSSLVRENKDPLKPTALLKKFRTSSLRDELRSLFCWQVLVYSTSVIPNKLL